MAKYWNYLGIGALGSRALVIVAAAAAFSACGKSPTTPSELTACTGNVTLSVSSGTTPTFTWTPACNVFAVLVEGVAGDTWYVFKNGGGIAPGVRYGVLPQGAIQLDPTEPLLTGKTYDAILFSGTTENNMQLIALRTFTPQ